MDQNYDDSFSMIDSVYKRVADRLDKEITQVIEAQEKDSRHDPVLYHKETQTNMKKAIDILSREINHMGSEEEFVDNLFLGIIGEHRTLQQGFIGAMFKVLSMYSKAPFDLRNEDSVRVCRKMAEVMKDDLYFRFI